MRLHDWPTDLRWQTWTPRRISGVVGATESLAGGEQVVAGDLGRVGFDLAFRPARGAEARAWRGLEAALRDGVDAVRYRHCDPDRPSNAAIGYALSAEERRTGLPWVGPIWWEDGYGWRKAPPHAALWDQAREGDAEIEIDVSAWAGTLERGTWVGFAGVYAMHMVDQVAIAGGVARCRIWPPMRATVAAGTAVTLRPVMVVRLVPRSGQWARDLMQTGGGASFVEVLHPVVRRSARGFVRPAAAPWWLAEAYVADATRAAMILEFDADRYAMTTVPTASIAAAAPAVLGDLAAATFAAAVTLTASSTGTARTYIGADGLLKSDITANQPRLDHQIDGRRFLLENAGTNLILQSNTLATSPWLTANCTLTNAGSPGIGDEAAAFCTLTESTDGGATVHSVYQGVTAVSGTTYTFSVPIEALGRGWCRIVMPSSIYTTTPIGYVNLATGAIGTTSGGGTWRTAALPGGVWLVSHTMAATASASGAPIISPATADNGVSYTGTGIAALAVGHVQYEAELGATGRILTTSGTVTRAIESAFLTAAVRALCNRPSWTMTIDTVLHRLNVGTFYECALTNDDRVNLRVDPGNVVALSVRTGGVVVYAASSAAVTAGTAIRIAFRIRRGKCGLWVNGVKATASTDTGAAMPTGMTSAALARRPIGGVDFQPQRIKAIRLYPAALSDAACAALAA